MSVFGVYCSFNGSSVISASDQDVCFSTAYVITLIIGTDRPVQTM